LVIFEDNVAYLMKYYACLILIIVTPSVPILGQLCNGSLGDPVVHINFATGGAPGPALKPGVTTYSHVSISCPQDGYYTLHNFLPSCFGNSWHDIAEDHTPNDNNGYYMLVNASYTPGDFFIDTVKGLCTNTTYEFAAWVMNVLRPGFCNGGIDPNLTFSIETTTGTVLAKHNSGNITESAATVWTQFGVFFKTPVNITDVVVRITNNAPGGCGNDIALDDITFRPCGPQVNAIISSNGKDTAILCEGNSASLTLTANYAGGFVDPAFQWQESIDSGKSWKNIVGATSMTYQRPATATQGSYLYKMLIGEATNFNVVTCRTASNTVAIIVYPLPVINVAPAITGCEDSRLQISAAGGALYNWTGPNGFTSTSSSIVFTSLKTSNAGSYSVTAISDKGCSKSATTSLTVFPAVNATVTQDQTICEGTSTTLGASGGSSYQWTPTKGLSNAAVSNPAAQPVDSTQYHVIVKNQHGCSDTATVSVHVFKKPVANAGPDKKTKSGNPVQIEGSASGTNISYSWTPGNLSDPASLTPIAKPSQSITYTLTVVSGVGCGTSSDNMEIRVYEIPNAFSPNGDGINDTWSIKSPDAFSGSVVEVYNRFGQIVFRSNGYPIPWNGMFNNTPVPSGTYYYVIDLKSSNEPDITGWVFIVR
jgi:gliding motility-associated-like protein